MPEVDAAPVEPPGVCPHVNRNDPRCGSRFCLGRIDQAFSVCFGAYHGCPMFHRINGERRVAAAGPPSTVEITVTHDGRPLPLRATGT